MQIHSKVQTGGWSAVSSSSGKTIYALPKKYASPKEWAPRIESVNDTVPLTCMCAMWSCLPCPYWCMSLLLCGLLQWTQGHVASINLLIWCATVNSMSLGTSQLKALSLDLGEYHCTQACCWQMSSLWTCELCYQTSSRCHQSHLPSSIQVPDGNSSCILQWKSCSPWSVQAQSSCSKAGLIGAACCCRLEEVAPLLAAA